jgi:hypothetical protein
MAKKTGTDLVPYKAPKKGRVSTRLLGAGLKGAGKIVKWGLTTPTGLALLGGTGLGYGISHIKKKKKKRNKRTASRRKRLGYKD